MELLVCCVFAYWLTKHLPELATEAAQGIGYGLRGEESPAAAARRQRLQDAGVDPASGGAFSQFAGNAWRDFWLDQDKARAGRRAAGEASADRSWWQSQQDRFDGLVDRYAQKWQTRPGDTPPGASDEVPPGDDPDGFDEPIVVHDDTPQGDPAPLADDTVREPIRVDATVGEPATEPTVQPLPELEPPAPGGPSTSTDTPGPAGDGNPATPPGSPYGDDVFDGSDWDPQDAIGGTMSEALKHELFGNCSKDPTRCPHCATEQRRQSNTPQSPGPAADPIRVVATVGEPHQNTATATIEGEPMSSTVATRGIPVTGVQSGAAECLSINRELETAVAEFQARLANIAARVHSMGDQTLGIVQFAGASTVVTRMAQAAEAVAATKAQAIALGTEVSPLLMQTRAEFLRRA